MWSGRDGLVPVAIRMFVAGEMLPLVADGDFDRVLVDERRLADDHVDAIAGELILNHVPFVLADLEHLAAQVVHRDLALAAVELVVHVAVAIAGEVQDRFADRLRGDRAGVEADAAQQLALRAR